MQINEKDKLCDRDNLIMIGTTKFKSSSHGGTRILVTGGAGFIGSYMVRHLVVQYPNYYIVAMDAMEYCASQHNLNAISNYTNFKFIKANIKDNVAVSAILNDYKIDVILHFAAQSHVDHSFGNSFEFTQTNVMGTHVLLENAKACKIKLFMLFSTDEVYGEITRDKPNVAENVLLAPTNPYAASKAAAEMLCNAYTKSFRLPIIITRCNNVFGPLQYPEKIMPKFIMMLARGQKCTIHGDGNHKRHYLFATDVIDAVDTVLHLGMMGEVYNIGTTDEISNLCLAQLLIDEFHLQSRLVLPPNAENTDRYKNHIEYVMDRNYNDLRYAIDSGKLKQLGWKPMASFEMAVRQTVKWYLEFGEHYWGPLDNILVAHPQDISI